MAARFKIIILGSDKRPDFPLTAYRYALWADVPAARQVRYADPEKTSEWLGANAADLTALRAGEVVEEVGTLDVAPDSTQAQLQAGLLERWQTFQSYITAYNPWQRTGSTWDGIAWTIVNNG